MIRNRVTPILLALASLAAVGCDEKGMTYGDANSIIAVMPTDVWEEISEDVYGALERTIRTVRDEKTFTVTYQQPYAENWLELRRFRQMLLVGTAEDEWIQEAFDEAGEELPEPGVHQVRNSWSRDQIVTAIVLTPDGSMSELPSQLDEVYALLDRQYRNYAANRMYFTGVDSALADTLMIDAGFSLLLPGVYRWATLDSAYVFRNDNPDPSELIRQVAVTWMNPAPASIGAEGILEWRARVVDAYYSEPQEVIEEGMVSGPIDFEGHEAFQVQAQWRNPPELGWPAGGPFITWAVTCDNQDRTYLLDAWLYAPGKEKYQYMIQLETILGTFVCGS
jgi:hypothetical protein